MNFDKPMVLLTLKEYEFLKSTLSSHSGQIISLKQELRKANTEKNAYKKVLEETYKNKENK